MLYIFLQLILHLPQLEKKLMGGDLNVSLWNEIKGLNSLPSVHTGLGSK